MKTITVERSKQMSENCERTPSSPAEKRTEWKVVGGWNWNVNSATAFYRKLNRRSRTTRCCCQCDFAIVKVGIMQVVCHGHQWFVVLLIIMQLCSATFLGRLLRLTRLPSHAENHPSPTVISRKDSITFCRITIVPWGYSQDRREVTETVFQWSANHSGDSKENVGW